MSLHALAGHMATKGRGGDSMLVHMTPSEVQALQTLAERHGGTLTINPETGQPEANFLKKILPMVAGFALGPAGFGLMSAGMAGAAVGGITALSTGSLSRGLMAGLGAYGGAGLAEGLAGMGSSAVGADALASANASVDPIASLAAAKDAATAAGTVAPTGFSAVAEGAKRAFTSPEGFKELGTSMGGMGKLAQTGLMAVSPIMADEGVQTTTPKQGTGYIRQKKFNPYTQQYIDLEPVKSDEWGSRSFSDFADGGIVALATGGVSDAEIQNWMAANQGADDKTIADAMQQYGVSTGQLSSAMGYNPQEVEQRYAAATAPAGSAAAQWAAANNIDINQQISNWALANPNASDALIDQQMRQYGISNEDVARALGISGGSQAMEWNTLAGNQGLAGLNQNINSWLAANPKATMEDALAAMRGVDINEADVIRATGRTLDDLFKTQKKPVVPGPITTVTNLPGGVSGGGNTVVNPNGTITTTPNIPGRPAGGFTGMGQVRDVYTQGGGSLGQSNLFVPKTVEEMFARYGNTSGSQQAYEYLMGKGSADIKKPVTQSGELMLPYTQAVLGQEIAAASGSTTQKYLFDPKTRRYILNPAYVDPNAPKEKVETVSTVGSTEVSPSVESTGMAAGGMAQSMMPAFGGGGGGVSFGGGSNARDGLQQINAGTSTVSQAIDTATNALGGVGGGMSTGGGGLFDVMMYGNTQTFRGQNNDNGGPTPYLNLEDRGKTWDYANGGQVQRMALGGLGALAGGGATSQYNLGGYSDGGRLLRGPGDGVSDSIPATIGNKQPARLADGEFVVPARIVSELGNGSTEAGARKLYAMMDRVQKARGKTTGKNRVAANTRADKYLPA
jgi:hypothetical protein